MNVIALDQPSKNCEGDRIVQEAELCRRQNCACNCLPTSFSPHSLHFPFAAHAPPRIFPLERKAHLIRVARFRKLKIQDSSTFF